MTKRPGGGHDRHAFCHPVQWEYLMMCDWRMKKINKRAGGVRERSGEGKAATIFIYGGFQKHSPWRCRRATSPPPNLVPVHRRHLRSFSISSNSVRHPCQCACPSSRLQYQLVHHGRQGPCRQRAVQSSRQRVDDGVATSSNAPASSRLSTSPTNGTPTSFVRIDDVELDLLTKHQSGISKVAAGESSDER